MQKLKFRTSLKTKMIAAFVLASVVPIIIVSWLLYAQASRNLKDNLFSYLEGISEMKKQALVMQIKNRKYQIERDASSLRVLDPLSHQMHDAAEKDKGAAIGELRNGLGKMLGDGSDFEEIYVVDTAGKILVSTEKVNEGKNVKDQEYFVQGGLGTYFQSFFLSAVTGKLSLVVASPIKEQDGTPLGVLAGRINLEELYKAITDVTGLGVTGESFVAGKEGDFAVFLTPTRHDPNSVLNLKIKLGDAIGIPIQKALQGSDGIGLGRDYRGKEVIAAWDYIPDLKWGMVTKMDMDEFERPMKEWRLQLFFLVIAIIVIVGIVAYLFAASIVRPINILTRAAERISKGETNIKLNIRSEDEIGDLAKSFERMLAALKFYQEEKDEQEAPK